ncbi:MAG: 2-C-methyl-D-erythritol 4-phosphate cytidylyltransferase [Gemmatimonadales bacterium]|nr:2-C-methyl-D-erythritol 4-phosphate cytidylyltransferase [Gemmatimonadales bacterium]
MPRDVGVIIVAAGQGTRLGGGGESDLPKQFRTLKGIPILLRAIRPFVSHPEVDRVVVVVRQEDLASPPGWLADLRGETLQFVAGGEARSDSVRAGLAALPESCRIVLVHDGARPFLDAGVLDAVCAVARQGVGAVAGIPLTDTVKQVEHQDDAVRVVETVPRERLWRAQTPQGFPRAMLERAYQHAATQELSGTDDARLVEEIGEPVVMVPDTPRNIKVTTPDDLAVAECLAELTP